MSFCVYIYVDPKTRTPRYVGKGVSPARAKSHLRKSTNRKLGCLIKSRVNTGHRIEPLIIPAADNNDAVEMEVLLISLIGREDLSTGPLFNLTAGGDGTCGRLHTIEERSKRVSTLKNKSIEERLIAKRRLQETRAAKSENQKRAEFEKRSNAKRSMHASWTVEQKTAVSSKVKQKCSKPCTVDGVTIYNSLSELIAALGQGKEGRRSPTFRYIIRDTL